MTLQEGLSQAQLIRGLQLILHLAQATPVRLNALSESSQSLCDALLTAAQRDALSALRHKVADPRALPQLRAQLDARVGDGVDDALILWGGVPLPPPTQSASRIVLLGEHPALEASAHRCVYTFDAACAGEHAVPLADPVDEQGWQAVVAQILAPPPLAPAKVTHIALPNGVIAHHTAIPDALEQTQAPRWTVLCAGPDAASSEALAAYLATSQRVLVASPERCVRLVMDMPLMCMGRPYTTTFNLRHALHNLLRAPGALHIDVVQLSETPDVVYQTATVLRGAAQLMHAHHLRKREAPPRMVVCSRRPARAMGPSPSRMGAFVAGWGLKTSIMRAGAACDLNWFDGDPPWESELSRLYFNHDEAPRGLAQDELTSHGLRHLLQAGQVDLMMDLGPFLARGIAARTRLSKKPYPLVGFLHSIHGAGFAGEMTAQLLQGGRLPVDCIISPSRCGALSYLKLQDSVASWLSDRTGKTFQFGGRVEVLPYGIDNSAYAHLDQAACRAALQLPEMGHVLLAMGRIDRREKADLLPLLQATRAILRKHPETTLVICGGTMEGDIYADVLVSDAHQLGIGHAVRVVRNASWAEKRLYHGAADIAVAMGDSVQETYGLSLLEAMAAGLPVVAAEWNGFREIVQHGETGLLVPTLWTDTWADDAWLQQLAEGHSGYGHRDLHESVAVEVPALIAALDALISNAETRKKMGAAGQALCRSQFDEPKQAEKLMALCSTLMDEAAALPWKGEPRAAFADPAAQRFLHYASHVLSIEDRVQVVSGLTASSVEVILSMAGIADRPSRGIIEHMLALCATPQTLASLEVTLAARIHQPPASLRRHILRALKYNLIARLESAFIV